MSKKVYVVTSVELGWDCIVGVFDPKKVTKEQLKERFTSNGGYVVFDKMVESDLDGWGVEV